MSFLIPFAYNKVVVDRYVASQLINTIMNDSFSGHVRNVLASPTGYPSIG